MPVSDQSQTPPPTVRVSSIRIARRAIKKTEWDLPALSPLAGNKDITAKDPTKIIGTVLHGLNTPLTVNGKQYSGGMPSWKGTLSNADIAAVLTYVRSSWGNNAPAVTEKMVSAVK